MAQPQGFGRSFAGFGGLGKLGESITQKAGEISTNVTSSVSELAAKAKEQNGESPAATPLKDAPPVAAALTSKSPDNVSKEELLDVLQKMNKKVKALSALRLTLTERVQVAETDKERLLNLVKHEILNDNVAIDEGQDEIEQLQKAWRVTDEQNSLTLQELQNEYKVIAMQCEAKVERIKDETERATLANGNEAWEDHARTNGSKT